MLTAAVRAALSRRTVLRYQAAARSLGVRRAPVTHVPAQSVLRFGVTAL